MAAAASLNASFRFFVLLLVSCLGDVDAIKSTLFVITPRGLRVGPGLAEKVFFVFFEALAVVLFSLPALLSLHHYRLEHIISHDIVLELVGLKEHNRQM